MNNRNYGKLALFGLVLAIVIGLIAWSSSPNKPETQEVAINMTAPEAVIKSERFIKESLADPESYSRLDYGATVLDTVAQTFRIYLKYSARNALNGTVTNEALLQVDSSGNVMQEK